VLRDFVELPSQLFEHWITEPEVLQRHARHWQTDQPIPLELIERLQRAARFNQGYETVRYCASAIVDMAVHAWPEAEPPADLPAFEAQLMRDQGLPHAVGMNHRLVHFQHLFAGSGYAAGYYVYLWAEVLDADAWGAFTEAGSPFDPAVADRLRRHVYAVGDSVDPASTYAAFRGRAPTVEPLLKKRGLLETL
jgi:peptidyl-dipeptidase Dcp